jgi:hypothetical protein
MTTETKPAAPATAAEALEEVRRLAKAEGDFHKQIEAKTKKLQSADVGSQVLDAHLAGKESTAVHTVTKLRGEIEALERASLAARDRRRAAILAYYQAQAVEARQKAAKLNQEGSEVDKKAAPLLQQLKELMGVEYVPKPLKPGYDVPINVETRSRAQVLRDEAQGLESQAGQLSRRGVQDSVALQGVYAQDFIDAAMDKPMVMAPPLSAIVEWFDAERKRGAEGRLTCFVNNGRISR